MSQLTRRTFLQGALAAAATVTIGGTKSSGRVIGANDTIRIGVAGLNGRGGAHVDAFAGMKNVQVTYLIDPDTRTFKRRLATVEQKGGNTPRTVQDVRKALEDKDLDAISIATPNHWHALMTIWACEAGKDVYVEKPCSHNVHEGRVAVEAARKHRRIVQHGTQSRSSEGWARVMEAIKSGKLGKLLVARGLCYKDGGSGRSTRGNIGFAKPKPAPPELDFNLWLGPAQEQPYHENIVHYRWHWFWDFGNGDMGNQGVHQMDLARWGIPGATLPRSVVSVGGRYVGPKGDQGETANTQVCIFDYGDTQLIFETRGLPSKDYMGQKVGNIFHLEAGTIVGTKFFPKGSKQAAPLPEVEAKRGPGGGPFENFIAAVRSRRVEDLNADILEGHLSSALCHLGNVSHRLGTPLPFNAEKQLFSGNPQAAEAYERMREHLKDAGVKFEGNSVTVGPQLTFDAEREQFVGAGAEAANKLLTRDYRKPFAVPDRVA